MTKRFELEEKIMNVWAAKEEIELVTRRICDSDDWTEDEIANMLIGISTLHDAKSNELFRLFEQMVRDGSIT